MMHILRCLYRFLLRAFFFTMTRLKVEGKENIPREGAFLLLPNHLSNIDGPLMLGITPRELELIGPGDFKVKPWIKYIVMKMYGPILVDRGKADSGSMKAVTDKIRIGRPLLMFPGGGMWEKRGLHYKNGAAYFSLLTQVRIVPAGISGTYMHTRKAFTFQFPRITVRFGEPIGPVPKPAHRERQDMLDSWMRTVEQSIFSLLEPEDQQLYLNWERMQYQLDLLISIKSRKGKQSAEPDRRTLRFPVLAELIQKPNLFRPLYQNTGNKLNFFRRHSTYTDISDAERDCGRLFESIRQQPFDRYIPYRMGEEAEDAILKELKQLKDLLKSVQKEYPDERVYVLLERSSFQSADAEPGDSVSAEGKSSLNES